LNKKIAQTKDTQSSQCRWTAAPDEFKIRQPYLTQSEQMETKDRVFSPDDLSLIGWLACVGDASEMENNLRAKPQHIAKAEANKKEKRLSGATPLMIAARCGQADCVRVLLQYSDASIVDEDGESALEAAAHCAPLAISASFKREKRPNHVECVQILAEKIDANRSRVNPATRQDIKTPLMLAVMAGRTDVVAALLKKSTAEEYRKIGGGVSQKRWSALSVAAYLGHLEICEMLARAEPRALFDTAHDYANPLLVATLGDKAECAALLAGLTTNRNTAGQGLRLGVESLDAYQFAALNGAWKTLGALTPLFAEKTWCRNHPLTLAATQGHINIVRFLLERGHKPESTKSEAPEFADGGALMELVSYQPGSMGAKSLANRIECAKLLAKTYDLSTRDKNGLDIVGRVAVCAPEGERKHWLAWACGLRNPDGGAADETTALMASAKELCADSFAFLIKKSSVWEKNRNGEGVVSFAANGVRKKMGTLANNPEQDKIVASFANILSLLPSGHEREASLAQTLLFFCRKEENERRSTQLIVETITSAIRPDEMHEADLSMLMASLGEAGLWRVSEKLIMAARDERAEDMQRLCYSKLMPSVSARMESFAIKRCIEKAKNDQEKDEKTAPRPITRL
jgi:ankyrin repeat protein